jgi:hypothetical protein
MRNTRITGVIVGSMHFKRNRFGGHSFPKKSKYLSDTKVLKTVEDRENCDHECTRNTTSTNKYSDKYYQKQKKRIRIFRRGSVYNGVCVKKMTVLFLFIFISISNYADIEPIPIELKSIIPGAKCKVQMVSETVNARVYKDSSVVECNFNMKNWGGQTKMEVGFPVMHFFNWSIMDVYVDDVTPFFEVYVGSKQISKKNIYIPKAAKDLQKRVNASILYRNKTFEAYRDSLSQIYSTDSREYYKAYSQLTENFWKKDKTYQDVEPASMRLLLEKKKIPFYVWSVNFKALEELKIRVIYRAPCGSKYKDLARYFYYILSTGAGWYKSIERATVRVRIMDFQTRFVSQVKPSNYVLNRSQNEYVWRFINLEPKIKDNVYLEYILPEEQL